MAFTKIQPQQLQLPTFISPSGDLDFTDNVTGVSINLDRSLDGDFILGGSLIVGSNEVIGTSPTNTSSLDSITIGGTNNTVTGSNNLLLNGTANTEFSGDYNVLVNGTLSNFGASGQNNTIVAGRQCSFDDQITGAVIIADHLTTEQNDKNHSLLVSFDSGIEFKSVSSGIVFTDDVIFNDEVFVNDSITLEDQADFNSNITVDGTSTFGGSVTINSSLDTTGDSTFGIVDVTGNLGVTGLSTFLSSAEFWSTTEFQSQVVLSDDSDAASRLWVDQRVGFSLTEAPDTGLTGALFEYNDINDGDLANVLTGTSLGSDIFTGHVLTGSSNAYFVLQGANFTGALEFTGDMYRAI